MDACMGALTLRSNDCHQRQEQASEAPLVTVRCMARCTPDMGMSLWGESPLWEDVMKSG